MLFQFVINGIINGLLYSLLAVAFSLTYNTTRIFHIAYAGVLVASCYFFWFFFTKFSIPFIISVLLTLFSTGLINALIEKGIYQTLEKKGSSHNSILVASIGIFIIIINLVVILFGNENKTLSQAIFSSLSLGEIIITWMQIIQFTISLILVALILIVLKKTNLGLKINALSHDKLLFEVFGNDALKLRLLLFFISGVMAAVVGLLIGYDVGFDPYFGMSLLLNALIAMIIGGFGSFKGSFIGGIIIGFLQSLSVYFFETRWETAITFIVLILILIFRPQGLFGVKQRWI